MPPFPISAASRRRSVERPADLTGAIAPPQLRPSGYSPEGRHNLFVGSFGEAGASSAGGVLHRPSGASVECFNRGGRAVVGAVGPAFPDIPRPSSRWRSIGLLGVKVIFPSSTFASKRSPISTCTCFANVLRNDDLKLGFYGNDVHRPAAPVQLLDSRTGAADRRGARSFFSVAPASAPVLFLDSRRQWRI